MSRKAQILFVLLLALIVVGAVFVMTWEIPMPATQVETVIPNDRFKP